MAYCKKFINGINAINFSEKSVGIVKNVLIAYAYQELKKESEAIDARLAQLPEKIEGNEAADEQLALYKKKQQEINGDIKARMLALRDLVKVNLEEPIALGDTALFISEFAQNFRNIRHLADTLADAPAPVKKLQTNLYVEMLAKLGQAEQEQQLQTLSLDNITDMIKQATLMYESKPDDVQLRNQCQRLAQMGFYEIVRRDCAKVGAAAEVAQYDEYKEFLSKLRTNLPGVGASAIIDNLSQYKDSNGHSVADLLAGVEGKFKITQKGDWDNSAKIGMVKERKALFDRLRFGQEDRREYARKTQENLTRDLFWARNIRDIELFTKSPVSDDMFIFLSERRYIQSNKVKLTKSESQKLEEAIKTYKEAREKYAESYKKSKQERDGSLRLLEAFKDTLEESNVEIIKGEIKVTFYHLERENKSLQEKFGTVAWGKPVNCLKENTCLKSLQKELKSDVFRGWSLADIERQLVESDFFSEKKAIYQVALEKIKKEIRSTQATKIEQLGLANSQEVILRRLLELQSVCEEKAATKVIKTINERDFSILEALFACARAGNYKQALEMSGLEASMTNAYDKLATLEVIQVSERVKSVIARAKIVTDSARERREKSRALEEAFQSGEDVTAKVEAIFLEEYTNETIAPTLGLKTDEDTRRLKKEIHGMAVGMVRLIELTRKGEPAISQPEQDAYFSILQQIAAAIKPIDLLDIQFKVKHSSTGSVDVVVLNAAGEAVAGSPVRVNLGAVKLPYSLVKPPGGEFIFSYGGTRGVIAPFEGLDEAYAGPGKQKGRLFTHSRLLGVGQYGSVKEVESLLSGLNQVVKKGYVPDADPRVTAFDPKSRDELRTRPITARDDPLYRIESDVLQNLSKAEKAKKGALSGGTQYWIEQDKPRKAGKAEKLKLFSKDSTPRQYQILTERAKGDTLADVANAELNLYTKGAIEYHDPSSRPEKVKGKSFSDLKDIVSLSQAIVSEAQKFEALKFSHNDIKPENFLYKRNPDGSYQVKYIDWATGGFKKTYEGSKTEVADIFDELFGPNLSKTITKELYRDSNGEFIERCTDANGRFVQKKADGGGIFGVKPTLQILHGARNGTLPYISPKVLGEPLRDKVPLSATAEPNPEMNTILDKPEDPYMDDWSLTAMAFGICNRQAYFSLVQGRAVGDYVIPTVLDVDGKDPQGLKITDLANFNKYFACGTPVSKEDFESGAVYTKTDGVMFIPSNQREGAPLHLYRRLQALQAELNEVVRVRGLPSAAAEQRIIDNIELILTDARRVVASGEGYSKEQLQEKLAAAQQCIKDYEQLNDLGHQQALAKGDVLQSVIRKTTATFHLLNETGKIKHLDILFTYPSNPEQAGQVKAVLDKVLPEDQINHIFGEDEAPGRHILKDCIAQGQNELLKHLLSKITKSNPDFIAAVVKDGLLHYAAEQGMTDVFNSLVDTLKRAGASETEIFKFMMQEYGPGAERLATAPHIKWATNGLHIAVRNNNEVQLGTILALFPNEEAEKLVEETISNLDDPGVLRTLVEATNNGPFKALEGCDQLNLTDQAYKSLQKVAAKRLELIQGKAKEIDVAQENLKWATAIAKVASEISEGGHDGQLVSLEKGKFSLYAHQRLKEIDATLSLQRSTFLEELYTSAIMAVAAERKRQKVTENSETAARVLDEVTNNVIGGAKLAVAMAKLAGEIAAGKHDKDLNTLKALSSGGQALVLAIRELKRIDGTLTIDGLSVEQSKLVETAAGQRAQQKEALATAKVTAKLSADANFKAIKESLHLCAVLGNKTLFNQIIAKYNALNPEPGKKIDAKTILAILLPPDDTSPYHLFMRDEGTQDLAWTNLEENRELAKTFLLKSPVGTDAYPSLIAAKNGNFAGVKELIRLGEKLELSAEEWTAFFKQSDESGKTLLNYALEQEQFTFLTELLAKVKTHCGAATEKTLVHLLSNPHPVNPLKNYLAVEKSEVKQFKVVNELLDAVCAKANPLKPELEQARLVALLVNKDWLIEKAQNEALHETLEKLLHSDALSIPFRRSLFAQLEKEAKDPAKTFFKGLLADVSPREELPVAPIVAIQLPPGIMQEVARQSGNLNELIAALASDREAVGELQEQVRELTETQAQLRESLTQEKETVVQTKAQLANMVRKVEQAEQSVSELRDEASRVLDEHTKRVAALQQEIAKRDEHSEAASLSLVKERADHQETLKGLQERLVLAESTRDNLASALKDTQGQLTTSLEAVQRLESEAIELNALNESLQEKLSASKLETVEARRVLGEELEAQRKETEKAQLEARPTLSSLEELRIEHSSLERRAVQLGEDNKELSSKVEALQVTLREREEEILLVREAEARERQSALLKQAEIEQLVRQLAEVAEQKALLVLKPLIKESDNVALLTAIYSANNPAGLNLDDIGWNDGAHVEQVASVRAIGDIVWQAQIQTAADERLTALSQQASNALKATIRDSRELVVLREIANAEENDDLRVGGGFDAHVEFLRGNAYAGVRDEARARLHALSEEASAALIESIRGSNNLALLCAFADAVNNDALRGHGLDNHVEMLGNEGNYGNADAFETIKDEAELRLATLTQEAKDALIIEVNNSHDTDLLDRVARVGSNFDLRGSGLTVAHVDALIHMGAYADISAAARDRLNANQTAIVALTDFINGCDDARFLKVVSGEARTNEFLEVTFRMFRKGNADHLRALIKEDAHTQFADLARARLLVLDAARHRRPDEPDPRIIAQEKAIHALQREIVVSKDKELLTAISSANSNAALNHNWHQVDELNLRNIQALVQDDAYLRVREAASRRIVALRDDRNEKRDAYADPAQYAATLAADRTTLTGINRRVGAISTVDDKVRSELRQLGAMNPMHWFSPAFRGAAKKNAIAMEAHFTELATTCKVIVDYLVPLRNELVEQINSIPVDMDGFTEPQKKALQDRKALLTTYLRKVEAELELYKPVYTQLYGDPRAVNPVLKDGILETIRRAKTDEGALEVFPFKSAATDHPMDERAAHFRAGYTSSATTVSARSTTLGLGARQARYTAGDAFKAGHFREHTINPDAARTGRYSGSYIEERASSYRTSLANASEYLYDLKLTITKFPEAPHGVPEDDPQLVEDRIHFAFACAVTLLSAFSEPPTASNQVILRGFEEKEMGYIWTALMTLGSEIPSMEFNHKAINVIGPTFKPANEFGTFYGYSSSSYQETLFKPHKAYVDNLLKGIKEACAERVIHQKTLEKADKLATSISSAYKSNFKQTMDELRENQDKGPEIFGR